MQMWSLPSLFIKEHWHAKKQLKSLAFFEISLMQNHLHGRVIGVKIFYYWEILVARTSMLSNFYEI